MNILLLCRKITSITRIIEKKLKQMRYNVTIPDLNSSYDEINNIIKKVDSILLINKLNNNIDIKEYSWLFKAFESKKKIYLMNDLPNNTIKQEIMYFNPTVLYSDLNKLSFDKKIEVYDKLVRDHIPTILMKKGLRIDIEKLNNIEYKKQLDNKLQEEVKEYLESDNIEEIADLIEVIYAILDFKGISIEDFEKLRAKKVEEKGAFKEKILLRNVINP